MLREARDLAARVGDVETAKSALEELAKVFAVQTHKAKLEMVEQLNKASPTPVVSVAIFETAMSGIDEAIQDDDYLVAAKLLKFAESAASKTKSAATVSMAAARGKEIEQIKVGHDKIRDDFDTLKTNPDDAGANSIVGRFNCFVKGDWKHGLPMLLKGDDEKLKALAAKELASLDKPDDRMESADAWWEFAQSLDKSIQVRGLVHAADLYQEAVAEATGLNKIRAEKRIADVEKLINTSGAKFGKTDRRKEQLIGKWAWGENTMTLRQNGTVSESNANGGVVAKGKWKVEKDGMLIELENGFLCRGLLREDGKLSVICTSPTGAQHTLEATKKQAK